MRKIYSFMFALLAFAGLAQAQVVFDFANNNLDLPLSNGDDSDAGNVTTISSEGVTISFDSEGASTHSRVWQASGGITLRVYNGSTFTISASKTIVNVTFDATNSNFSLTADPEGLDGKTWTGAATAVTFVPSKTNQIRSISVFLEGDDVPTPPTPSIDWTSSADAPLTVAAALEKAAQLAGGEDSGKDVYVKGIISQIVEVETEKYGNATYYISDDGNTGTQLEVYRGYGLGGEKFTAQDDIEEGDEVIVVGVIKNYVDKEGNSTLEFNQGSKIYSLNGVTASGDTPTPQPGEEIDWTSSAAAPLSVAAVLERAAKLEQGENSDKTDVYVRGKVSNIKYSFDAEHGTATFSISDDGTEENQFLCYATLYLGNRSWVEGDTQIALGDDVIVCGTVTNFKGTLEMASKKNYLYSLNGVTDGGDIPGPGPGPGPEPTETRDAPITNPYSVAEFINIEATSTKESVQEGAWVKGYIVGYINGFTLSENTAIFSAEAPEGTDKDGNPLTAAVTNILIADAADATSVAVVAPIALKNNSDARRDLNLADNPERLGAVVWVKGNVSKYMGVTGLRDVTDYSLDGSTIVAIRDLNAATAGQAVYNLAGQRVANPAKGGIYIVGGRKMVK